MRILYPNSDPLARTSKVVLPYAGLLADIPSGWQVCDGTNGTPDLRDRFIRGSTSPGGTGGQDTVTEVLAHSHRIRGADNSVTAGSASGRVPFTPSGGSYQGPTNYIETTGVAAPDNRPAFYSLVFIQRIY